MSHEKATANKERKRIMNIIEFAIGFVLVIAAFVLGFCIGVKAGASRTLEVVKLAMDETLANVQKNRVSKIT